MEIVELKKFTHLSFNEEEVYLHLDEAHLLVSVKAGIVSKNDSNPFFPLFKNCLDKINFSQPMGNSVQQLEPMVLEIVRKELKQIYQQDLVEVTKVIKELESKNLKSVYQEKAIAQAVSLNEELIEGFLGTRFAEEFPELKQKFKMAQQLLMDDYVVLEMKFADYIKKFTQILHTLQDESTKKRLTEDQRTTFTDNCRIFGDSILFKHMRLVAPPELEKIGKIMFNQKFTTVDDLIQSLAN